MFYETGTFCAKAPHAAAVADLSADLLALLLFWPRRVSLEGLISPEAVLMDADSGEVLAAKTRMRPSIRRP